MNLKEADILADKILQHWYCCSKAKAMTRILGENATLDHFGCGRRVRMFLAPSTSQRFSPRSVIISYDADSDALEKESICIQALHQASSLELPRMRFNHVAGLSAYCLAKEP